MPPAAASIAREESFRRLETETFDVLVIGGGINGCGVARDAALRGLSVALIEKNDFGSGTSGRSSRMIHGGVRYLEHGYFRLVMEASRERRILLRTAPHLVSPMEFLWPVYARARIGRFKQAAGLGLYDAMALFRNTRRHQRLSAEEVLAREPVLRTDDLRGGAIYLDAVTDDARLTLANALAARDAGAVVLNHALAELQSAPDGRALVHDQLAQTHARVSARLVVVAVGPWDPSVRGTKGSHILVPRSRTGHERAITYLSPDDQRVLFMVPQDDMTLIGTTDIRTSEPPDEVRASEAEIGYLLRAANSVLGASPLRRDDVVAAWSGIRPLAAQPDHEPAEMSREHTLQVRGNAIVVTGGKLTTYRAVAEQVVNRALKKLRKPYTRSVTAQTQLPGADLHSRIVSAVASQSDLSSRVVSETPHRRAELFVAARDELAATLGDLLIRRTQLAFRTPDHGLAAAAGVAELVGPVLGWDAARQQREVERYESEVAAMF